MKPEPVETGQLRKWIPECDAGFGPFLVLEIRKGREDVGGFLRIHNMIARVMYRDGRVIEHGLIGMEDDSELLDGSES
jgi:hypothetical protein